MESVLEFKHISKYFPGVKALDDICFKAYGGEVLAFLGENGAGKSTLLKVLNGDYKPDAGEYLLNGEQKHFKSPQEAIEEGISVIYQERQILLELSVAENIYLGRMPSNRFGVINTAKANQMAQKIIEDFGLPISPSTKVKDLSIAYQQMVEIMKAYSRDNLKVICFDEPTASLSDAEIEQASISRDFTEEEILELLERYQRNLAHSKVIYMDPVFATARFALGEKSEQSAEADAAVAEIAAAAVSAAAVSAASADEDPDFVDDDADFDELDEDGELRIY